ncbi:hypothetical protein NUW58_g3102 [Xylaria curta]|uniref:Uncharacterized protein n=1 Tax=Xylaria curta TaxID=42375 RepID=A0ACC1PE24_9PEZI|nr:hypothetical protein NUW58_g3102 [Xylaria curta]
MDPARQIRVFILKPGLPKDPLVGSFEIVTIVPDTHLSSINSAEWEAVSYVWGNQELTEPIRIDGSVRCVTHNVISLLIDLRWSDKPRRLWIDGICINQDDPNEKSQQIGIMLQVYQNAKSVIIWLKEISGELAASLAAIQWMEKLLSEQEDTPLSNTKSLQRDFDTTHNFRHGFVGKLLANPWFTRIWVIQEAVVARNLLVFMASELVPWDSLVNLAFRFAAQRLPAREALTMPLIKCYLSCLESVDGTAAEKGISMIYLIQRFRMVLACSKMVPPSEVAYLAIGRTAKLPHDMIYAMNGLFKLWASHFPTKTDYSSPPSEIFKSFVVNCIEHEQNLDILSQLRLGRDTVFRHGQLSHELPTWSLDWTFSNMNWTQRASAPAVGLERPSVSFAPSPHQIFCHRDGNILMLYGFIIDEIISNQTGEYSFFDVSEEQREAANRLPRLWRDGDHPYTATDLGDWYWPHRMKGGGVAFSFGKADVQNCFVCYLFGARHPIILNRVQRGPPEDGQFFTIALGTCIIEGFEDGKGLQKCLDLGLEDRIFQLM